jgi:uncharacterized protein YjbI with pentapeptide repeats
MPFPSSSTSSIGDLPALLRASGRLILAEKNFADSDLRGANLRGVSIVFVSLAGALLDGADLTGAAFRYVNLTHASFSEAKLDSARFEYVHAGTSCFAGSNATNARWEHTDLTAANFTNANLRRSVMRTCALESIRLDGADLTDGSLAYSVCEAASFQGTILENTETVGAQFARADFAGSFRFFRCREIVVELLRREAGNDFEMLKLVGAAQTSKWCYGHWHKYLLDYPEYMKKALAILGRYPESGAMEALRDGWDG